MDTSINKPIGYIYKITNNLTGLYYIGKREKCYFDESYWGSGTIIKRLIEKYGTYNFSREILEWVYGNHNDICECEKKWISLLDSTNINKGYNLTKGGDGFGSGELNPRYGIHSNFWDTDVRKHQSDIMKGRKFSDEHKKHLSESLIGKIVSETTKEKLSNSWDYNKHITEHFREKCSITRKGKKFSEEHNKNVSIGMTKYHKENPKVWINDGKCSYKVLVTDLEKYLDEGYVKGRLLNMGERMWINNGDSEKYIKKEDLAKYYNWNIGRLRR